MDEAGAVLKEEVAVMYGQWLQTIVDFLIIAFCIFVAIRIINNVRRTVDRKQIEKQKLEEEKKKTEEAKAKEESERIEAEKKALLDEYYANVREQVALLREIKEKFNN